MNFKPSDKVVCVNEKFRLPIQMVVLGGVAPKKDVTYVVRGITICRYSGTVGLLLVGIECTLHPETFLEYGWDEFAFRKLEEIQAENKAKKELWDLAGEAAALDEAFQLINTDPDKIK
jgi:hypothetical protein